MMTTYWDLSERERAELSREDVERYVDAELMLKGVLRVKPPVLAAEPEVPQPTKRFFSVTVRGQYNSRDHVGVVFETLEQAADAISAYLPHRKRPKNLDGLKKNLRHRDGRWFWHWDPAFLKPTNDDPFVRVEQLEQAAVELTIPILLIRGKLSDVVSPEGVQEFLAKVPAAEFVELSDAGHTAAGDDNDAFSAAVVSFVTR